MKSVADQLRRDLATQVQAMSVDGRFELVARLAELKLWAAAPDPVAYLIVPDTFSVSM